MGRLFRHSRNANRAARTIKSPPGIPNHEMLTICHTAASASPAAARPNRVPPFAIPAQTIAIMALKIADKPSQITLEPEPSSTALLIPPTAIAMSPKKTPATPPISPRTKQAVFMDFSRRTTAPCISALGEDDKGGGGCQRQPP